ncbi:hypothetical protein VPHK460_0158 [Vibrio phage K460]
MKVVQYHLDPENDYLICATNNGWLYPFPFSLGMLMRLQDETLFNNQIVAAINDHITGITHSVIARRGSLGNWRAIPKFLNDEYNDPHPYIGKHWEDVLSTLEIVEVLQ